MALVTGGGTGIGFGIASELARYGAAVAIASRSPDHLTPALDRLQAAGATALGIETNVREPESIKAAVTKTVEEWGRIDILVNNAAGNFYAPSAGLSPNGWKAVVETDLYGTFYGSQAVHPIMREQGGGKIISTSMTLHYRGWPLMAHATAAKAGVDALTRTLAVEWARDNITVNAVAPGPIITEGAHKAFGSPEGKDADAMVHALCRVPGVTHDGDPEVRAYRRPNHYRRNVRHRAWRITPRRLNVHDAEVLAGLLRKARNLTPSLESLLEQLTNATGGLE